MDLSVSVNSSGHIRIDELFVAATIGGVCGARLRIITFNGKFINR